MNSPFTKFDQWFREAKAHPEVKDASAMTLATATKDGKPAARIVLLKDHSADGFVFYGNMESRKFRELRENPFAALCFYWLPLDRQVRIEGSVTPVSEAEADAYFATRGRGKQIGAWASLQSSPMPSRAAFEARIEQFTQQFERQPVPRPPHWSGFCLAPLQIEFWSQGEFRLHTREVYRRPTTTSAWTHELLYP